MYLEITPRWEVTRGLPDGSYQSPREERKGDTLGALLWVSALCTHPCHLPHPCSCSKPPLSNPSQPSPVICSQQEGVPLFPLQPPPEEPQLRR